VRAKATGQWRRYCPNFAALERHALALNPNRQGVRISPMLRHVFAAVVALALAAPVAEANPGTATWNPTTVPAAAQAQPAAPAAPQPAAAQSAKTQPAARSAQPQPAQQAPAAAAQTPAQQAPAHQPASQQTPSQQTPSQQAPAAQPEAAAPAQQAAPENAPGVEGAPGEPGVATEPAAAEAPPAPAPPPPKPAPVLSPEVNEAIAVMVNAMDNAEKKLAGISTANDTLSELRDAIDDVISQATKTADSIRPRQDEIDRQLSKLGPPPAKDAPAESATVVAERERLALQSAELDEATKTLRVTWWRARQAIDKITNLRLSFFVKNLTERITSPLFPQFWTDLARVAPNVEWRLKYNANDWISSVNKQKTNVVMLLAAVVGLYLILKGLALAITRYRPNENATPPTFFERAASASWIAPVRAIPGIAATCLLFGGLDYFGLLYDPTAAPVGAAIFKSALIFVGVSALITAVFAPGRPERRLVLLSSRSARRISRLIKFLALIYCLDLFLSSFAQVFYFPLALSVVQSLVTSLAFAFVLIGLLLTPFEASEAGGLKPIGRHRPLWLKVPLWLAAFAIIGCCLVGYVALGRFLAQQLVMTGVVGMIATLLYLAIRAFTRGNTTSRGQISVLLEERMGFDETRRKQLGWLTESLLTLGVILATIPVLMLQWGFSGPDIRDWSKRLLFGFEIGQFRISLVRILVGIAIFVTFVFITRLVQRRLRENVLVAPRMDPGIANSIDTAVGYAGTGLGAIAAISYAGFDITNLAIVAGALSVGIGFGLQSIVNNFVSGLILLIERPIKVGDLVVVGGEQGIVKRISVRSTEIETSDRASLIVPNSELVTGRVLNWTHRNALGRVVMKFSSGPDTDPRLVLAVLAECANRHPHVLSEPAPVAVFEGYSPTTTDFSLRVLLPDITHSLKVQSDLRVAIYEALRRAHIGGSEGFAAHPAVSEAS
jgi:small-conductance mechanosensitive channel